MTKQEKQTLTDIWTKRQTWLENKTWNGDDPKCGFDFSKPIKPFLPYDQKNWNDLTLKDLRRVLDDLVYDDFPELLSPDHFTLGYGPTIFQNNILSSKVDPKQPYAERDPKIMIISSRINDQPQFTIYTENAVFSISWYKSRGKIDSIIDTEYGNPATLEDITDILVALKLEEPYELDDENEDDENDIHDENNDIALGYMLEEHQDDQFI